MTSEKETFPIEIEYLCFWVTEGQACGLPNGNMKGCKCESMCMNIHLSDLRIYELDKAHSTNYLWGVQSTWVIKGGPDGNQNHN